MLYPESLLHLVWKFKMFRQDDLCLTGGEKLEILHPGMHNRDAGPDFLHARLRIGHTGWAGNVEIHRCSSDWNRHGHERDPAYKNVLIHVVESHDTDICDINGRILPTLELKQRLPDDLLKRWNRLEAIKQPVPCRVLGKPDALIARNWLDRMLTERLEIRGEMIMQLLEVNKGNWQETFYVWLARAFGFHVNALPFEMLARSIPLSLVLQHIRSLFQLEALLFGQSGLLLDDNQEEYPAALYEEYRFLKHKFNLHPIEKHLWKFLRMRPANFPTVRIAQFAACLALFPGLLQSLIYGNDIPDFTKVEVSPYWQSHYHFEQKAHRNSAKLGIVSANILVNNVIGPFLLIYGRHVGDFDVTERVLDIFRNAKPEQNHITLLYKELFPEGLHGGDSQAMLHLKTAYCDKMRCTDCNIGQHLLGRKLPDQSFEK